MPYAGQPELWGVTQFWLYPSKAVLRCFVKFLQHLVGVTILDDIFKTLYSPPAPPPTPSPLHSPAPPPPPPHPPPKKGKGSTSGKTLKKQGPARNVSFLLQ